VVWAVNLLDLGYLELIPKMPRRNPAA
jgi:hypothetical protein